MKKLLVALAIVLAFAASPAQAVMNRVAVFQNSYTEDPSSGFNRVRDRTQNMIRVLRDQGFRFDVFQMPDTASYGAVGIADSTWFRQRYDAVLVPALTAISATQTDPSNRIHLGFRNDGRGGVIMTSASNAAASPFSGNWSIPVFVSQFDVQNVAGVGFTNGINGILGGTQDVSTKMQMTTPSCPTSDGTTGDTIFVQSRRVFRDVADVNVTVLLGGVNGKTFKPGAAADTIAFWRYKPGSGAGTYYSTMRECDDGTTTRITACESDAILLGQMCQVAGIKPPHPDVAWIDMDHVCPQSGTVTFTGRSAFWNSRDLAALGDSLRSWRWVLSGPIQCGTSISSATLASDNSGQGFQQDSVRVTMKQYEDVFSFHVHDHFNTNTSTWRSSAQDTISVCRTNFNLTLANGQGSAYYGLGNLRAQGSFGFYATLPQDDGDWRALKVFGDAGVREIRINGGDNAEPTAASIIGGSMSLWAVGFPMRWQSIGPNSQMLWVAGRQSLVGSTLRDIAGFSPGDYASGVCSWVEKLYIGSFIRGGSYFHGNENFQGKTSFQDQYAPPILFLKHTKNVLKLTWPAVQPMWPGNIKFKNQSVMASQ